MSEYIYPNIPTSFKPGDTIRFNYTGSMITLNTKVLKKVKIECYGEQGCTKGSYIGGYGGYTFGELDTTNINELYITVGGGGGFNGGAKYRTTHYSGGATDVRTIGGTWDNTSSLKSRLIVAAGGGGADDSGSQISGGGHGGGWSGLKYSQDSSKVFATQSAGGEGGSGKNGDGGFGFGGKYSKNDDNDSCRGTGGSGWYGGAAQSYGGGGGSSYVAGNPNCPTPHPDNITLTNSGTTEGKNTGDGYCIITVIEAVNTISANCKIDGVIREVEKMSVKIDSAWKEVDSVFIKGDGNWKKSE